MGEHRPQASQGLGGDPRAELGDVALQVGADEALPPAHAGALAASEEAVREPSSHPELVEPLGAHLGQVERSQFDEVDSPGERLAGLGEQLERRRAQQEESPGPLAFSATGVDRAAQRFEQARRAVDLVEDDQLVGVVGEIEPRRSDPRPVRLGLQVEVDRPGDSRPPPAPASSCRPVAGRSGPPQAHPPVTEPLLKQFAS